MVVLAEIARLAAINYGLNGVKIKVVDSKDEVYKIESKEGIFALKKNKYPQAEFLYIYYGMEHLAENNFNNFNRIILTQGGFPCLTVGDKQYFLSRWLEGKPANYTKAKDVEQAALGLAKFHRAGSGYQPYYYAGRIKWGQNLKIIQNKMADLCRWQDLAQENPSAGFFDLLYKKNVPSYLACFAQAEKTIAPVFKVVDGKALRQGSFCHHDLANHNLLLKGKKVSFIDFDYAISDTTCHDLAGFMLKILKANAYDPSLAKKAYKIYTKALPLDFTEKQMLVGFLQIPQCFWQLGLAYYDEEKFMLPENRAAKPKRLEKLESRLNSTLNNKMKREKAIDQLREAIEA